MGFEFECPRGHLLEAEPEQAGEQHVCPACGITFIVPECPHAPATEEAAPETAHFAPQVRLEDDLPADFADQKEPELLHIPCPQGHPLETPRDMLGQDVRCPFCGSEFRLRETDSLEHQRKVTMAEEQRAHRLGKAWLNWTVTIAVVVVIGLLLLIILGSRG